MRRADRLFRIVLLLGRGRMATAAELARGLGVSTRTLYRDVADLTRSGVPIEGAAGVGFRLKSGYQVPPLMFTEEELQALYLGVSMVRVWSDSGLAGAAERLLAKVEAALPVALRPKLAHGAMIVPGGHVPAVIGDAIAALRHAILHHRRIRFAYPRPFAERVERTVWPLGLIFWGGAWTLAAWCEMRADFRSFRVDAMNATVLLPDSYPLEKGRELRDYLAAVPAGDAVVGGLVDALRAADRPWPVAAEAAAEPGFASRQG